MVVAGDGVARVCGVCEEDWELSGIGNRAPVNWCGGEYVDIIRKLVIDLAKAVFPAGLRCPLIF